MCKLNPRRPHDQVSLFCFFFVPALLILCLNFACTSAIIKHHEYSYFLVPAFFTLAVFTLVFFTHRKKWVCAEPILLLAYSLYYLLEIFTFHNVYVFNFFIPSHQSVSLITHPLAYIGESVAISTFLVELPLILFFFIYQFCCSKYWSWYSSFYTMIQIYMLTFLGLIIYECIFLSDLPLLLQSIFIQMGLLVLSAQVFLLLRYKPFTHIIEAIRGLGLWKRVRMCDKCFLGFQLGLGLTTQITTLYAAISCSFAQINNSLVVMFLIGLQFIYTAILLSQFSSFGVIRILMSQCARGFCYEDSQKMDQQSLLDRAEYKRIPPQLDRKRIERTSYSRILQRNKKCEICGKVFKTGQRVALHQECQYGFHNHCFKNWIRRYKTCPYCYGDIH